MFPLNYIKANYTTQNQWKRTIDYNLVRQAINQIVADQYTRPIQSEVLSDIYIIYFPPF